MFDKIKIKMERRKYDKYKKLGYYTDEFVYDQSVVAFMTYYGEILNSWFWDTVIML